MTKIFPNAMEPLSSPFNRQQLAALGRLCDLEVLATIPWFPGASMMTRWTSAGRLSAVPGREMIDGLRVAHPRFAYVPRVGLALAGPLYAASLLPHVLARRGAFDVLLGTWAYPDGFATVALAKALGVPSVVKLHGSDINVLGERAGARRGIGWALAHADAVVAVSRPLGRAAVALGARPGRVHVVMNGVDRGLFQPGDRGEARGELGLGGGGSIALYVGRLERAKGAVDLLEAFALLAPRRPEARLVMVGDGAAREECSALARSIGPQVVLAGPRPHAEIARYLAASDLLALPSWNEGTPNVVLEALAAGRRVVATRVGGIPDLLADPALGELTPPKDPGSLAEALDRVLFAPYDPGEVVRKAPAGGWDDSARALHDVLECVVKERRRGRPMINPDPREPEGPAWPKRAESERPARALEEEHP